ncbi:MAG: YdeI/OmpD-associated family protein [Caldilineaceae bacterium]|nr:YdeI/OmpD-associated family protein [Caldilineaceae bacterium]
MEITQTLYVAEREAWRDWLAGHYAVAEIAPVLESVRDIDPAAYMIPADILTALQTEPTAWAFFQRTSPAYRRIRAAYVDHGRRRPGEFEKRLANLVKQCAAGKQFGYGIEEYY